MLMAVSRSPQGKGERHALPCVSFSLETAEGKAESLGLAVTPYGPSVWEAPSVVPMWTLISGPQGKIYQKETQSGG